MYFTWHRLRTYLRLIFSTVVPPEGPAAYCAPLNNTTHFPQARNQLKTSPSKFPCSYLALVQQNLLRSSSAWNQGLQFALSTRRGPSYHQTLWTWCLAVAVLRVEGHFLPAWLIVLWIIISIVFGIIFYLDIIG